MLEHYTWEHSTREKYKEWMRDHIEIVNSAEQLAELTASSLGYHVCPDTLNYAPFWYELADEVWAEGDEDCGLEPPVYQRFD
ncbi:MAG: hypothetical protein ACXABY_24740 [Candidatus Thorarchaeota archaeon]|jgi:hypothetical protein